MDDTTWGTALAQTRDIDRAETRVVTRTALVGGGLALLLLTPIFGLTTAGLSSNSGGGEADSLTRTATASLDVTNYGLFSERDPRVEIAYPGLPGTGARREPQSIGRGASGRLVIDLEVDCTAPNPADSPVQGPEFAWDQRVVDASNPTLSVTTARPWGRATAARVEQGQFLISTAAIACTDELGEPTFDAADD